MKMNKKDLMMLVISAKIPTKYWNGKTILGGNLNAAQLEKAAWEDGKVIAGERHIIISQDADGYNRTIKIIKQLSFVCESNTYKSEGKDYWEALYNNGAMMNEIRRRSNGVKND